jgi:hypothetical protein
MNTSADDARLTIHLHEPDSTRLRAALSELVERAHAFGLRAATMSGSHDDAVIPRQFSPTISLSDAVHGTVNISDDPERLRVFAATVSQGLAPEASIRLDIAGTVHELDRLPLKS